MPNPPLLVQVLKHHNDSILIAITNGPGHFDNYFIEIKDVKSLETTNTTVNLNQLKSGYMYEIYVRRVANGLNSTSVYVNQSTCK